MLKFVSLAAKSGRREISRQTIRKILPKIDDWNFMDDSYPRINELGRDGIRPSISSGKLLALYKYVKHIIIPELEERFGIQGTQDGIKIMGRLCEDIAPLTEKINKQINANEKNNENFDYERMLLSTIFCRNGELHRKLTHDKFGLNKDPNKFFKEEQEPTKKFYIAAIVSLPKDPSEQRMITRRYKAVHGYANYALECVSNWRAEDTVQRKQARPYYDNLEIGDGESGANARKVIEIFKQTRASFHKEIAELSFDALTYFYESVKLSQKSVLQDMLRILKIMSDFDKDLIESEKADNVDLISQEDQEKMMSAIRTEPEHCDPERWLKVVPQLIAIMDMKHVTNIPGKLLYNNLYKKPCIYHFRNFDTN